MITLHSSRPRSGIISSWIRTGLLFGLLLALAGCGSTKVYMTDKTIVYGDSVYNVSEVKVFRAHTDGVITDGGTVDLKGVDKRRFREMLESQPSILVRQVITMDDLDVVYQSRSVSSWSELDKMNRQFSSAAQKVQKFLADKSQTQLKLK